MKPIEKEELYAHLSDFLKNKASNSRTAVTAISSTTAARCWRRPLTSSQQGVRRAKSGLDGKLDEMAGIHTPEDGAQGAGQPACRGRIRIGNRPGRRKRTLRTPRQPNPTAGRAPSREDQASQGLEEGGARARPQASLLSREQGCIKPARNVAFMRPRHGEM